ncbi:MBL fold metallo-hydrolase [Rhodococcus opacus]|uniref:MBL fold metallo-hydrolase n=1 Tax=Rhodococcus opacus TaxID=37919 RepID=UPI0024748BA4|nr:MBL fold metallo-hydrolase [Rhodococcus opacus]
MWGTALPFPSPLEYSFGYLVQVEKGCVAVDLGWNSDVAWSTFTAGLNRAGQTLDDLIGVVVTHVHPDHYGLARRIRDHTGAWLAMHSAEVPQIAADAAAMDRRVGDMTSWLARCGVPGSVLTEIHSEEAEIQASTATVLPDVLLADGDQVPDTQGALVARHTPGHTPGHLCFHERERNIAFTGDHILPRVTPNVSRRPGNGDDPLADYLRSLDLSEWVDEKTLVLPGHEWAFDTLQHRTEVLVQHSLERGHEIEKAVAAGASTVWEITKTLRWARPFDQLASRGRRQAIGETHAQLYWLRNQGRLEVKDELVEYWSVVTPK